MNFFQLKFLFTLGSKYQQKFVCNLIVDSFDYVGKGVSINKKDAKTKAAKNFARYLLNAGYIPQEEIKNLQVIDIF